MALAIALATVASCSYPADLKSNRNDLGHCEQEIRKRARESKRAIDQLQLFHLAEAVRGLAEDRHAKTWIHTNQILRNDPSCSTARAIRNVVAVMTDPRVQNAAKTQIEEYLDYALQLPPSQLMHAKLDLAKLRDELAVDYGIDFDQANLRSSVHPIHALVGLQTAKTDFYVDTARPQDVVELLRDMTGLSIAIEDHDYPTVEITALLKTQPLDAILDQTFLPFGFEWSYRDGCIWIRYSSHLPEADVIYLHTEWDPDAIHKLLRMKDILDSDYAESPDADIEQVMLNWIEKTDTSEYSDAKMIGWFIRLTGEQSAIYDARFRLSEAIGHVCAIPASGVSQIVQLDGIPTGNSDPSD